MNAEIITVGSEILLGETLDTNSSLISRLLRDYGINCFYHTSVGDNKEKIIEAIKTALKRSDLIITTGGLGSTKDDITIDAIAQSISKKLVFSEEIAQIIKNKFNSIKREMPKSNLKQAYIPEDSDFWNNKAGIAPAIISKVDNKTIIALQGVPSEVKYFCENDLKKYLEKISCEIIKTEHLKFVDISEAKLGEMVEDLMDNKNPTVATLASSGEATIRLGAKDKNPKEAKRLIDEIKQTIIKRLEKHYYGSDKTSLEEIIGNILTKKNKTISVAESCSAGEVSSRLANISGSSNYIKLNVTTYSNEAKNQILKVEKNTLEKFGAVSKQTATQMAQGIRNLAKTDYGVGITGILGPLGGSKEKPVGLVYVAITDGKKTIMHELRHSKMLDRLEIKKRVVQRTLGYIKDFIES